MCAVWVCAVWEKYNRRYHCHRMQLSYQRRAKSQCQRNNRITKEVKWRQLRTAEKKMEFFGAIKSLKFELFQSVICRSIYSFSASIFLHFLFRNFTSILAFLSKLRSPLTQHPYPIETTTFDTRGRTATDHNRITFRSRWSHHNIVRAPLCRFLFNQMNGFHISRAHSPQVNCACAVLCTLNSHSYSIWIVRYRCQRV